MIEHNLTEIILAEPVRGEDMKLYLYDKHGFHGGAIWFTSGHRRHPDEQISAEDAKKLADLNIERGLEVRITNGGDFLLFHAKHGKALYPAAAQEFWSRV